MEGPSDTVRHARMGLIRNHYIGRECLHCLSTENRSTTRLAASEEAGMEGISADAARVELKLVEVWFKEFLLAVE